MSTHPEQQHTKPALDLTARFRAEAMGDNEPIEVPIVDRDGDPYTDEHGKPAVFLVLGEYSDAVKAHDRKATNQNLRGGFRTPDADDLKRKTAERLWAATVGWRWAIDGEAVPFGRDYAMEVYTSAPWIADQVHGSMRQRAGFFGPKSSG
jgi:hypothetical protein